MKKARLEAIDCTKDAGATKVCDSIYYGLVISP